MKPDFNAMSRAELLAYLKEHRTDDEAWGIFSRSAQPLQSNIQRPWTRRA